MRERLSWLSQSRSVELIVLFCFAALIVAFGVVFTLIWDAEERASRREIASVQRVFESHKYALLNEMERYAASNAAYINIEYDFSGPWVKNRFADDMAEEFPHSGAFLLSPDDQVAFEHTTAEVSDVAPVLTNPMFQAAVAEIRTNFRELRALMPQGSGNFSGKLDQLSDIQALTIKEQVALVGSFAIVPDPGGIPISENMPYVLVTIHLLDRPHLDRILQNLSLAHLEFSPTPGDRWAEFPILGADDSVKGYLTWPPMSRSMIILLTSAPVLLLFVGLIVALATIAILRNARAQNKLKALVQKSLHDAQHDSLTGFAERKHFYERAADALDNPPSGAAALIYCDIDRFKHINDTWGHAAGDEVIKVLSSRINTRFATNRIAGRVGGDEFVILVTGYEDATEIETATRDLLSSLNQPLTIGGKPIAPQCRAGVAHFPDHGQSAKELMHAADVALRHCKTTAQRDFAVFDPAMDDGLIENRELRSDLQTAAQDGQLELYYQPILRNPDATPTGVEALLRWNHPTRGLVPPDRFLPLAEASGLMPDIGKWVVQNAIKDAAEWPMAFGVSINVNSSQLLHPEFAQDVENALATHGLPAEKLTVEITESQILDRIEDTQTVQQTLNNLGVRFALDDFGTGYSSLSYLHLFEFHSLKIDKSFLVGHNFTDNTKGLLTTMINIGQVLSMSVVVEGVETEAQRAFLRHSGCDFLQGFLFARPLPLSDLLAAYGQSDMATPRVSVTPE
ncbi:bifunctional diguanylate cyclase/phosphodiesterase [Shimia sp. R11_0]|uniref:putative bifunctional diguanylate cyclase/phosphodiesterase n=1 Tax=Shimia sp. R11_0 TaxID=2821096 RepID=UPI001ADB1785|nr:bifunctional diguanylate cyclase/phosphodiesterase [Shimia sp. R11_0]